MQFVPEYSTTSFSFICINQSDVLASILHVKSDALGLDNMRPNLVKLLLPFLLPYISHISLSSFPIIWKNDKIRLISRPNNDYWPISTLHFFLKVFKNRMSSQIKLQFSNNSLLSSQMLLRI